MEVINQINRTPSIGNSLSHGWDVMKKNFLILLLTVIVVAIITGPTQVFRWNFGPEHHMHWHNFDGWDWHTSGLGLLAIGMLATIMVLFALAYAILVVPVFKYGARMIFVQAVRGERPDFNLLVKGFRQNYLGIVLAGLLVFALVGMGIILLIVPGIIIACRLAFVGYLVMDKNLDPIKAIEESWRLTRGYGWTIFGMAILSFFIIIAGLCVLFVGVFPASAWIGSAFATLYQDVQAQKAIIQ